MTLPTYIATYLHRHTPEYRRYLLDDPQTTLEHLMLDALCPVEIAMLIEDENPGVEIADEVYEAWRTLADVAEAARVFEGVGG